MTPAAILDQTPGAIIALDGDGRIVHSTPRADAMFGFGPGALLGRGIDLIIPGGFGAPLAPPDGDMTGAIAAHAKGHRFQVDIALGRAEGLGEAVVLAVFHDVSAREAARDKSRFDDQLLAALVDGIVDYAVFMLDLNGVVVTWNAGARAIKGYEADEIIGRNFSTFFTPEDRRAGAPQTILQVALRAGRFENEGWRLRKDGTAFLAHVTIDAIRDSQGRTTAFAKITRDITERRRQEALSRNAAALSQSVAYEKSLAEANARAARAHQRVAETLNAVIAASPLGLCTINTDGVYEIWNPVCETLFGYAAAEIIGRPHHEVAALMAIEGETVINEFWPPPPDQERGEREVRRLKRDGTILTLRISYAPIRTPSEALVGHVYVITDLTDRRRIEHQLQQAQKMEAIGQLTGGIAHDFNNLLSIIIVNLQFVIEDAAAGSDQLDSGEAALAAALRGAELIQRMLSFARIQQLETRVIDVKAVVRDMTLLLTRILGENIDIAFAPAADLWPAMADPVQLQSALANLATNARDAMGPGGHLMLATANAVLDQDYVRAFADLSPGDYVMISVSDTGKGMSAELVARAFDPFFTTKPEGQGTGLGLSMVFGFAKQSAGHVRIYSEPGVGTTVKMFVPRATGETPAASSSAKPTPGVGAGVILVVEDNEGLAKAVERMLGRAGYATILARDAAAALAIIAGLEPIDLMFTDIVLGSGAGGIELAAAATAQRPGLKVLFTSGFAENALTGAGQTAVADRLLSKPYVPDDLLDRISRILEEDEAGRINPPPG